MGTAKSEQVVQNKNKTCTKFVGFESDAENVPNMNIKKINDITDFKNMNNIITTRLNDVHAFILQVTLLSNQRGLLLEDYRSNH